MTAVTDGGELSKEGPLAFARASYVAYLRDRRFTFDQLVADIATVCAGAYLLDLVD